MSGAFCGATVTPASRTVLVFFFASLILSLSHAALSAVLAVAPALLGEQLGSAACGTLFIAWVVSSLVASYYMRVLKTPRRALLVGLAGNVIYLSGTCAAAYFDGGGRGGLWVAGSRRPPLVIRVE